MSKKALLLTGSSLFLVGYIQNYLVMHTPFFQSGIAFLLSALAVIVVWICVSRASVNGGNSKKTTVLLLNAPAFIVLLLLLFQEFVLGRYWLNWAGMLTQAFYLPVLRLYIAIPVIVNRVSYAYIMNFICLLAASYWGYSSAEPSARGRSGRPVE